jgi:CelD/BcsL family acetyltransferase involved in cellulose biosynthesis
MVRPHANHYVDLAAVRDCGRGYLALLGSKTRYRIRRSCREYEKLGAIRLRRAADATEASTFLDELKALHQAYWTARGQPGAFASRYFDQFHHNLVRGAFGRGEIQLLRIDVADRPIGYVYNFLYRGRVYNYQTGFDYQVCAKGDRPGIVSHVRAIEFNAERGNAIYDFLGGDLEYKRELGTHIAGIYQVILQRDRMRFRVEDAMHTLYRRLRGRREDAAQCNRDEAQVRLETEP